MLFTQAKVTFDTNDSQTEDSGHLLLLYHTGFTTRTKPQANLRDHCLFSKTFPILNFTRVDRLNLHDMSMSRTFFSSSAGGRERISASSNRDTVNDTRDNITD